MIDSASYISFTPEESEYNDFKNETYPEKLFSSLVSLVATPRGSHPYDPNYGVGLRDFLFMNDTGDLATQMENDVTTAIRNYIPELVNYVKVVVDREVMTGGNAYKYTLRIVVQNVIVNFNILQDGSVAYANTDM